MEEKQPYIQNVNNEIARLISCIDREPSSNTYGCGDRQFWCWKFTDFPGARYQEYLYLLSWLYTNESSVGSNWHKNKNSRLWLEAGINYWCKIQYNDGSFDEAYPFERSLAATAFTLFYVSECYFLIKNHISEDVKENFLKASEKAANWLCNNDEKHGTLSNHLAAAAAACLNASIIHNNSNYEERCNYYLDKIYNNQSHEGWYKEYSGADIGYQTHCTFYLACIWQKTKDARLIKSLRLANKFLIHFIHPDGSIGGEYASRNTMFYFPAGYEILGNDCVYAKSIADELRDKVCRNKTVGISQMDPQNIYPMINNYIFAYKNFNKETINNNIFWKTIGTKYYREAGLYIKSTSNYFAVIGGKKGGVIRIWSKSKEELIFQSCGYYIRKNKKVYSSQSQNLGNMEVDDSEIIINAPFTIINQKTFNPNLFIGFRIFNITIGRIPKFAYLIKRLLVKVLVNRTKKINLYLNRNIIFKENIIIVKDELNSSHVKVKHSDKFTSFHMGSSRYVHENEEKIRGTRYLQNIEQEIKENGIIQKTTVKIK